MFGRRDAVVLLLFSIFCIFSFAYRTPVPFEYFMGEILSGRDPYVKCTHYQDDVYMFQVSFAKNIVVDNKSVPFNELVLSKKVRLLNLYRLGKKTSKALNVKVLTTFTAPCLSKICEPSDESVVLEYVYQSGRFYEVKMNEKLKKEIVGKENTLLMYVPNQGHHRAVLDYERKFKQFERTFVFFFSMKDLPLKKVRVMLQYSMPFKYRIIEKANIAIDHVGVKIRFSKLFEFEFNCTQ